MFGTGADQWYCDEDAGVCKECKEATEMLTEWYGVSDVGIGIVEFDDSITCLDDVVDRYLEAIDYFNRKIHGIDEDFKTVIGMQLENPIETHYEEQYTRLAIDRIYYTETRDILQKDLDRVRGVIPPWE